MATPLGPPRGAAVVVVDAEGTVTSWTPAAQELLGRAPAEVLGRNITRVLFPGPPVPEAAGKGHHGGRERRTGMLEIRSHTGESALLRIEGADVRPPQELATLLRPAAERAEPRACSLVETLMDRAPMAISVWDPELRCIWVNDTARSLFDVFPYYQLGRSLYENLPNVDIRKSRQLMRQVLADGIPQVQRETHRMTPDRSRVLKLSVSYFRLSDEDGRTIGVCSMVMDIGQTRTADHTDLLHEASIRIGSTLEVEKTAQEVADLAVPAVADYVTVDLAEAMLPGSEPLQRLESTKQSIPIFYRAGAASIHEGMPESLWKLGEAVFVPPSSPFTEVLASGRAHFEPVLDTSPGTWLDQDPARARIIRSLGMHTLIIVPLKARGEILGIIVFVRTDNHEPFTANDLVVAEALAARAALSLDNARRYTRERTAALALQHNMLPPNLVGTTAVELASRYIPSDVHEVGGDWFDAIPLRDGRIALVVGDVTGHGIHAAATMGRLRMALRTLAHIGLPPDELLTQLDDMIVRMAEENGDPDGLSLGAQGATCLYAVYDPITRRCTLASAGHPPPAVVSPGGQVAFLHPPTGTPIGLGLGSFPSLDIGLPAGSTIVLYTDGLIETRLTDIEAGIDDLGAAMTASGTLPLEDFCSAVISAMVGEGPAEDDIALLVARTPR